MHVFALLALLPLIATATPTPKAEAAAEPYNPFFPPDFKYDTSHTRGAKRGPRRADLESRAALEHAGEAHMAAKRGLGSENSHEEVKRGSMRKIKRTRRGRKGKRATACAAPTSTAAPASTATSAASMISASSAPVSTSIIGGNVIVVPSSSAEVASSAPADTPSSAAASQASSSTAVESSAAPPVSSAAKSSTQPAPTTAATSSSTAAVESSAAAPVSSAAESSAKPVTTTVATTSTTSLAATSTTSSAAASATTLYTVDPAGNGPFSGWGTWFDVGLSACGTYDTPGMPIVAVSAELFDSWPGYAGTNPNDNPICGKHLDITWGGKTLTVEVTDRCPGCAVRSLDLSKGAFHYFADYGVGLLGMDSYTGNITWSWTEGTGRLPQLDY